MDRALQAITIMATFSVAHERVIEFARWWIDLSSLPHDAKAALGCIIMGLAVTLGSSFWDDLS